MTLRKPRRHLDRVLHRSRAGIALCGHRPRRGDRLPHRGPLSSDALSPSEATMRSALRHALFLRPGTARLLSRSLFDSLLQGGTPGSEINDPRRPSHLHINLVPEARGAGASRMESWFGRLGKAGPLGCHQDTLFENRTALAFFERAGFERFGDPRLAPGHADAVRRTSSLSTPDAEFSASSQCAAADRFIPSKDRHSVRMQKQQAVRPRQQGAAGR